MTRWWTKSWNPVIGCTKCSPACENCYAEALHTQRHKALLAGVPMSLCYAEPFGKVRFLSERLTEPLHWRKPQRIFVGNMGDLFHDAVVSFAFLDRIFAIMARCPQHTFMLLTKRPELMHKYLTFNNRFENVWMCAKPNRIAHTWPLPNVWLGTTIWDQASADRAVPLLLSTPAAKRFVSVEPMLGPVDLGRVGCERTAEPDIFESNLQWWDALKGGRWIADNFIKGVESNLEQFAYSDSLDWVICGGETGKQARPMHPDWPRSLRDQCVGADVPFFFKQWGEWGPTHENGHGPVWWSFENYVHYCNKAHTHMSKGDKLICPDGHVPTDGREDGKSYPMYPTRRIGKAKAGRVLDGREWSEVPA